LARQPSPLLFVVVFSVVVLAIDRNDSHLKWESCLWAENTTTHETTTPSI
jgi:MFS superfamily sulfate permease-like transporter